MNEDIPNDDYYAKRKKCHSLNVTHFQNLGGTDDVEKMNLANISNDIETIKEEPERIKLAQADSSNDIIGYSTLTKQNHSILRRNSDEAESRAGNDHTMPKYSSGHRTDRENMGTTKSSMEKHSLSIEDFFLSRNK